jgi:hypothetical protein|tara:strand:+ start:368 stop:679 length:312 start_codon:yes stop_codon:yes gene_type:complete
MSDAFYLTPLEHKFLKIMCNTDFSFEYEGAGIRGYVNDELFTADDMLIYRGVMSSLIKKKIIVVDDSAEPGYHDWTWVCCIDSGINAYFYDLVFNKDGSKNWM